MKGEKEKEKTQTKDTKKKKAKKDKKEENIYMEDDIIPEMKEAKVIKKTSSTKKPTKSQTRSAVDDLIKRKSQTEQSAYSDIG